MMIMRDVRNTCLKLARHTLCPASETVVLRSFVFNVSHVQVQRPLIARLREAIPVATPSFHLHPTWNFPIHIPKTEVGVTKCDPSALNQSQVAFLSFSV